MSWTHVQVHDGVTTTMVSKQFAGRDAHDILHRIHVAGVARVAACTLMDTHQTPVALSRPALITCVRCAALRTLEIDEPGYRG